MTDLEWAKVHVRESVKWKGDSQYAVQQLACAVDEIIRYLESPIIELAALESPGE